MNKKEPDWERKHIIDTDISTKSNVASVSWLCSKVKEKSNLNSSTDAELMSKSNETFDYSQTNKLNHSGSKMDEVNTNSMINDFSSLNSNLVQSAITTKSEIESPNFPSGENREKQTTESGESALDSQSKTCEPNNSQEISTSFNCSEELTNNSDFSQDMTNCSDNSQESSNKYDDILKDNKRKIETSAWLNTKNMKKKMKKSSLFKI